MMRRVALLAAMIAAGTALLPAMPASAATALPVLKTSVTMSSVPSNVAAKGTMSFTVTFHNQSTNLQVNLVLLAVQLWSTCLCPAGDIEGNTAATYRDPSSGGWRTAPPAEGSGYSFELHDRLTVPAGHSVAVPVNINVSRFRSGNWIIDDTGVVIGNVYNAQGDSVMDFDWQRRQDPQRHFTIGAASKPIDHSTTPSAKPQATKPSAALATKPIPMTSAPAATGSHSPTSSAAATPSTYPATPSTTPQPAAEPANGHIDAMPVGSTRGGKPSPAWLLLLVPPVLIAVVARRRTRPAHDRRDELAGPPGSQ